MSLVNWNNVTPPDTGGPGRELASINGLLSALADRRERAQQEADRQALAEREFAAREANTQADNVRADARDKMTHDYYTRSLDQSQANQHAIREEQRRTHGSLIYDKALALRRAGYVEDANALLEQHFAQFPESRNDPAYAMPGAGPAPGAPSPAGPAPQPGAPPAPPQPQGPGAVQPPPFVPQSPGVFPGAAPTAPPPGALAPNSSPAAAGSGGPPPAPAQGMGPGTSNPAVGGSTPPGGTPAPPPRLPAGPVLQPLDTNAIAARRTAQLAPFEALAKKDPATYGAALDELKANVATGMLLPKAQQIFLSRVQFKQAEAGRNTRFANAVAAGAAKGRTPGEKITHEAAGWDHLVQPILTNERYSDTVKDDAKLQALAATVDKAGDSAAMAAMAKGAFVKMAQGGTGVVSDQDMVVFWNRMGGWGIRTKQAFQDAIDGKMGTERRDDVLGAIHELQKNSLLRADRIGASIVSRLSAADVPGGKERIGTYLQTYVPTYYRKWLAQRAKGATTTAPADTQFLDEAEKGMQP